MRGSIALLTALLVVSVLVGWQELSPPPLSKEQQELLKERDRLRVESRKLRADDELDEAVAPAEKALAIERKVLGETHETVATSLQALAHLHELREDFVAARKVREEVVTIQKKRHGDPHWRVTNAVIALAGTERAARMTGAERQELAEAAQLNKKAMNLRSAGQRAKAIEPAEQSAAILKRLLGEKDPYHASGLILLATLYVAPSDQAKAEALFKRPRRSPGSGICKNSRTITTRRWHCTVRAGMSKHRNR
jgi:Tetratricopeptide repeat